MAVIIISHNENKKYINILCYLNIYNSIDLVKNRKNISTLKTNRTTDQKFEKLCSRIFDQIKLVDFF